MTQRFAFCLLALLSICSIANADTIVYATGNPPGPAGNLSISDASAGTSSFFDIYVNSSAVVAGLNLDVFAEGTAIKFSSATVPNYSGPRWASTTDGTVAGDGLSVTGLEGFALPGFGSTGMNPAAQDDGFNGVAGAFHFARVNYDVLNSCTSNIFLQIGANEWSTTSDTTFRLGVGDDAVCVGCQGGLGGARSTMADGVITVLGAPTNTAPVVDALAPINVAWPDTVVDLQLTGHDAETATNLLAWSNLVADAANPSVANATLGATGLFNWDPTGLKGGTYNFNATVTDDGNPALDGSGLALTINYTVPEPATLSLFGLALVGFIGFARKRS
jgi:PEP-CTERM motif